MKNLILFSFILLFIASCKKNKTKTEEVIPVTEKKVLKKLRFEINIIEGDSKNFHFNVGIANLILKDDVSYTEPIIIKPANLRFIKENKSEYLLEVEEGKAEKNYIIESKEPVQLGLIVFTLLVNEHEENPVMVEIKVFADEKQIGVFDLHDDKKLIYFSKTFEMNKYF